MKTQSKINCAGRIFPGVILLLLLITFGSSTAMACHKGKPHGKDAPDVCEDLPDPVTPDVLANWGGLDPSPGIQEGVERLCVATQMASDSSSGTYTCDFNPMLFPYNFGTMNSSCIRCGGGNSWYCEPETPDEVMRPEVEYSISWSGDCTSAAGCDVEIVNLFPVSGYHRGHPYSRRTLEAFATVSDSSTPNPLESEQAIVVDNMHYTYFALSSGNKLLAKCNLDPSETWPVIMHTRPDE